MATDFISREAAITAVCGDCSEKMKKLCAGEGVCGKRLRVERIPPADVVSRDCYNRILAENDTMRNQLAQIGKKPGDEMNDVRIVSEISDAVDEVLDFLNDSSHQMPYHIYSALHDLVSGICSNCGSDMRETGR